MPSANKYWENGESWGVVVWTKVRLVARCILQPDTCVVQCPALYAFSRTLVWILITLAQ